MIQPSEVAQDVVAGGELGQINLWKQPSPVVVRRARAILRRLGVADLALRAWGHLSQGERQKVLMARALATKPRLLILDEPCAGLDPVAREDFVMFMNEVIRLYPASTLVLVTHHVEEIGPRFTHGLFLRGGRMQVQGDLRKILNSSELTKLWQRKCVLRRQGQRWSLTVSGRSIRQKAKIS
jgi:iron complex transport system ATP-binding protein